MKSRQSPSGTPAVTMSALGHEQTSRHVRVMSVIPLKADIHQRGLHVRLMPLTTSRVRPEKQAITRRFELHTSATGDSIAKGGDAYQNPIPQVRRPITPSLGH